MMWLKKTIELIFIYFSKIYIHFYKDKREYWTIFPSLIVATLVAINLQTALFYLNKIDGVNADFGIWFPISIAVFFLLLFRNIKYEDVENYEMSNKTKIIISVAIIVDLAINFILANISRNGKFTW